MYRFLKNAIETGFDVVSRLKETERGTVELLRHKETGTRFILRSFRGSAEVYRRLLTVECPYLPRTMEAAEEDGQVLALEEYVEGDSLAGLLEGGLFNDQEARQVGRQLCEALWVLHSLGAVHRDVKPENVILRQTGAVLIDFDASRIFKEGAATDTRVLGTTGYAPPEQYGLSQTDPRSDIYALGVLLNVMVTGEHPSRTLAAGRLGRVVRRCTQTVTGKRYQSAAALMEAL